MKKNENRGINHIFLSTQHYLCKHLRPVLLLICQALFDNSLRQFTGTLFIANTP